MQDPMIQTNKNSSSGPDRVTSKLVFNGGKNLVAALKILMQGSYQLGYFPKAWKKENRFYLKKPEKSSFHVPSLNRSISLNNTFGKTFERVILQEPVNTFIENNFFEGKTCMHNRKTKMLPKPYFHL